VTRLLVSVRSAAEALLAAEGGADFIDLKEPSAGALGGLPVETIAVVLAALRVHAVKLPVSATIGDLPMHDLASILERVGAVAACGVDYVKVGIERGPQALAVLDALAMCRARIVPVFIADHGVDAGHLEHACALRFPGLMIDTADKSSGSVFDVMPGDSLERFVARVREGNADTLVGVAGALRLAHVPRLRALAPDFAGFRSAVCAGARTDALDAALLHRLAQLMHAPETVPQA
jgi:(5-formylfuran-3-yl)methyl phosphate synthase